MITFLTIDKYDTNGVLEQNDNLLPYKLVNTGSL